MRMTIAEIDVNSDYFRKIVDDARKRSGSTINYEECYNQLSKQPTKEMLEKLKQFLKDDSCSMEDLQNLIACLWVLYELGSISFPQQDFGIALSIQTLAKIQRNELAGRLLHFLELSITITGS